MNDKAIFQFPEVTTAHVTHVQTRKEKHGDADVLAMDVRLRRDAPNEQLALLDTGLREALYWNAAEQGKAQERLPDVLAVLPDLRFPLLDGGKHTWAKGMKVKGYRFTIDYGMGEDAGSNLDFTECAVANLAFEVKPNGLSSVWWTVQIVGEKQLTDRVLALLPKLQDTDVHFQLVAPAVLEYVKAKQKDNTPPPADPGQRQLDGAGAGEDDTGGDSHDPLDPNTPEGALAGTVAAEGGAQ